MSASRDNSPAPPAKRQKLEEESSSGHEDAAEIKVGIKEFLNGHLPGFSGVLKQRYSDFLVNEIDLDGNVVHLKTVGVPKKEDVKAESKPMESTAAPAPEPVVEAKPEEVDGEFSLKDEDRTILSPLLGDAILDQLFALYSRILKEKGARITDTIQVPTIADKSQRTQLHQTLRRVFNSRFESKAKEDGSIEISVVRGGGGNQTRGGRRDNRQQQKQSREERYPKGEYLHFTLLKENRDTMDVLSQFSRLLNVPFQARNKTFAFAGTKDRRAITVQRCSALRMNEHRLAGVNKPPKGAKFSAWRVGDFEWKPNGLELGDLRGNQFTITLRKAKLFDRETTKDALSAAVDAAAKSLEKDGFINYFGLQRFGTFSKGTHEVGRKILQSDWHGAIMEIIDYDPAALTDDSIGRDDRGRAQALRIFHSGEVERYEAALKTLPRKFVAEHAIIQQAQKLKLDPRSSSGNWYSVLLQIPRNLRTMYAHSYQSYVWNTVASERIRRFGKRVVAGDLVLVKQEEATAAGPQYDEDGDPIIEDSSKAKDFDRARPITQEEVDAGKFSLEDIVISSPGFDVEYPQNGLLDVYKDIMAKDNLDPLSMRRPQKEFSLPGSYRNLIGKVIGEVEHEVVEIRDEENAVKTDLDIIKEADGKKDEQEKEAADGEVRERNLAVVVKFKLGTSMYATMALRELMKAGGVETFQPEFHKVRGTGGTGEAVEEKNEDVEMKD